MTVEGLVLAAGAGRRYGRPKALVPGWLGQAVDVLREGGCPAVTVVLGAESQHVVVPPGADVVVTADWAEGMGASLRAGLQSLAAREDVTAALVHLVDLPDVAADVVHRVIREPLDEGVLRRATYGGRPGHPVLLGRAHWKAVVDRARGDRGARALFRERPPEAVECGDLATGLDHDRPAQP
jgi:CTP:molybdopterin cytidylyltransferase MocA